MVNGKGGIEKERRGGWINNRKKKSSKCTIIWANLVYGQSSSHSPWSLRTSHHIIFMVMKCIHNDAPKS